MQNAKVFEMPPLRLPKILRPNKSEHVTPMRFRNPRIESNVYENHSYHRFNCYDFLVTNSNNYWKLCNNLSLRNRNNPMNSWVRRIRKRNCNPYSNCRMCTCSAINTTFEKLYMLDLGTQVKVMNWRYKSIVGWNKPKLK